MKAFENSSEQSKIVYLFIFCFAGLFLATTLVSLINELMLEGQFMESAWGVRISSAVQMLLMFFMPAITLLIWSNKKPMEFLGVKKLDDGIVLSLLAFLILLVSMPFISLLTQLNKLLRLPEFLGSLEIMMRALEDSAEKTTLLLLSGKSMLDYMGNILFVGVFAAVAEEFFFRGVLQQLLVKLFKSKNAGVWLTALIFSAMHLQFYGFLPRLILGLLLGYLFVWSKNIWLPILIHFLNNALVITFNFFFKESAFYQSLEDPSITLNFIIFGLLSLTLTIFLLWMFKNKTSKMTKTVDTQF
ncbi:MAG: CPBP family intramembrane glutamic endopeptidase [Dysgonamonadaceae bacterium]